MKTLKDFYDAKKRQALYTYNPIPKSKYKEPQETLGKYLKQTYNPRLRKLKEAEYFREEWIEPETTEVKA